MHVNTQKMSTDKDGTSAVSKCQTLPSQSKVQCQPIEVASGLKDRFKHADRRQSAQCEEACENPMQGVTNSHQPSALGIQSFDVGNYYSSEKQKKDSCTCDEMCTYTCGGCGKLFKTVCELHKHLLGHEMSGSYRYTHHIKTAYPTFDTVCAGSQTGISDTETGPHPDIKVDVPDFSNAAVESQADDDNSCEKSVPDETIKHEPGEELPKEAVTAEVHSESDTDVMDETYIEHSDIEHTVSVKVESDISAHSDEKNGISEQTEQEEVVCLKRKTLRLRKGSSKSQSKKLESKSRYNSSKGKNSQETGSEKVRKRRYTLVKKKKKKERTYSCNMCDKAYTSETTLSNHQKRAHSENESKPQKVHSCRWCGETFQKRKSLIEHSELNHKNEDYKCFICNTGHTSKEELKVHLITHRTAQELTCMQCKRAFGTATIMNGHARHHQLPKNIQCEKCGKAFFCPSMLRKHLVHCNDERSFECQHCQLKFKTRVALKHHSKTHDDLKPYMCEVCGFSVKQPMYLKRHMRVHTGERPYACKVCGMSFTALNGLHRHRKTHTNQKTCVCSFCGKGFTNNWNLKTHERQHTGDTPYKCPHCGMGFKQNVLVKLHIKSYHPHLSQSLAELKTSDTST